MFFVLFFITLRKGIQVSAYYAKKGKKNQQNRGGNASIFTENSICKAAKMYSKDPDCLLAFDTDVLLEYPRLLIRIRNESNIPILISERVRSELDNHKNKNLELSPKARGALKDIALLHQESTLEIVKINKSYIEQQGFDPKVNDDVIIGSYLEKASERKKIIFITNDVNARTTARLTALTPLELNWDSRNKKKERKTSVFRPGYALKLISIISLSLGVGFVGGHMYLSDPSGTKASVSESGEIKFSKRGPNYIEDNYPFVIKSEYNEIYQGKKTGDWGAIAVVDSDHLAIGTTFGKLSFLIAAYTEVKVKEKSNQLTYVLFSESGKKYEGRSVSNSYDSNKGLKITSKDMNVKFTGINSYDFASFDVPPGEYEQLGKGVLHLVHKMTGELIQKIPITPIIKTEE